MQSWRDSLGPNCWPFLGLEAWWYILKACNERFRNRMASSHEKKNKKRKYITARRIGGFSLLLFAFGDEGRSQHQQQQGMKYWMTSMGCGGVQFCVCVLNMYVGMLVCAYFIFYLFHPWDCGHAGALPQRVYLAEKKDSHIWIECERPPPSSSSFIKASLLWSLSKAAEKLAITVLNKMLCGIAFDSGFKSCKVNLAFHPFFYILIGVW